MATLSELLVPKTRAEILDMVLAELAKPEYNLQLTDFAPGAVGRTLVEADNRVLEDLYQYLPIIAASGFLELASGEWLDIYAASQYDLARKPSEFAVYQLTLTLASGLGPYDILSGQLTAFAVPDLYYQNTEGGTINGGDTLELEFRSESSGSRYNVAQGAINSLLTPLPGLSVSNGLDSLLVAGADVEDDLAYRRRCKLRWAELGQGGPKGAYQYWALTAHASVTKVQVLDYHPRGPDTVDVYIWGDGAVGSTVVDIVNDYIQIQRPMVADVLVAEATGVNVTITATVTVKAGLGLVAETQALAALNLLQQELDIGATLYRAEIIERIQAASGVINTDLSAPAADVNLADTEAVTFTINLTVVEV